MTSPQTVTPTLHILNKAPGHPRFEACLQSLSEADLLVLTESGVLALADHSVALPGACRAVKADLQARALGDQTRAQAIDYADLVRLTTDYSRIISW